MKKFSNILFLAIICAVFSCQKDEEYILSVQNSPSSGGTVTKSPNMNIYPSGTSVTLTANPGSDYQFSNWEGDVSGTSNPKSVTMNDDKNIIAVFTQNTYTLTIQNSPANGGTVTKSPEEDQYAVGTSVTLTATPVSGYQFNKWEGDISGTSNPITFSINENKNVTAVFTQSTYTLTIQNSPSNGGTVSKSPNQNQYEAGTSVALTATPSSGYQFSNWVGDVTGTSNPTSISMDGNKNVTAVFTETPNPLITLSETNLTFTAISGGNDPATVSVNITNGGSGFLSGLSRSFPDGTPLWLSTSLSQTTAPAVLTLRASMSNPFGGKYPPGTYTTRIAISSSSASNSPQYINVTFIIEEPEAPSSIMVYASYDNAVMYSSMTESTANTVFSNSEIGVGVDYYWNLLSYNIVISASALYFEVQSQIEGRSIESAILRLNVLSLRADFSITPQINVSAIATTWNPTTLNYNYWIDKLQVYNSGQVKVNAPSSRTVPLDIDVTAIVKYWAAGTFNNYGLALRPENHSYPNSTSFQTTYFQSIDVGYYDSNEKRPQLIIQFK